VPWACWNSSCVDNCQDLTIPIIDDVSGYEINPIFVEAIGRVEGNVGNLPIPTCSRTEALTSRLLRLKNEVQREGIVLKVELVRKDLEVDLLGVVEVLQDRQLLYKAMNVVKRRSEVSRRWMSLPKRKRYKFQRQE
jgi:hypothetical protein